MKIRELFTRIGFDIDDKPLKQLDSGIKQVRCTILAMSGAAVAAGGVLSGLARSVADVGDKAGKAAQALGLTTEAYQELLYVASLGGVKQEEFGTALRRLSHTAMEAGRGGETCRRAYDMLGISVTDAAGRLKKADILIPEIADRLSRMEDGAIKAALAFDLFGRSGTKPILPLIVLFTNIAKQMVMMVKSLADTFGGLTKAVRFASFALGGLAEAVGYASCALAVFLALKFLAGIGSIAQGIWGLVMGFKALGTAGMLASRKVLALLPLIGEAVAALALALEGVFRLFSGDNSLTGAMVDAFKKKYPEAIEATKKALRNVRGLFREVAEQAFLSPGKTIREAGGQVSRAAGRTYPDKGSFRDKMKFLAGSIQIGHTNIPPSVFKTVQSPRVSVHAPITVNVPPGTPRQDVGPRVQAGIKEAIDEMLRQTYWATSPQVDY